MAQDVAAQESGRGNIPTPEVFGTTVYNAIANNNYPQLRAVSALSLDLNEMETIGSDIIKVIVTKLNNNGFVDPEIGNQMLKSIRKDLGSPEGLAKQMKEWRKLYTQKDSQLEVQNSFLNANGDYEKVSFIHPESFSSTGVKLKVSNLGGTSNFSDSIPVFKKPEISGFTVNTLPKIIWRSL